MRYGVRRRCQFGGPRNGLISVTNSWAMECVLVAPRGHGVLCSQPGYRKLNRHSSRFHRPIAPSGAASFVARMRSSRLAGRLPGQNKGAHMQKSLDEVRRRQLQHRTLHHDHSTRRLRSATSSRQPKCLGTWLDIGCVRQVGTRVDRKSACRAQGSGQGGGSGQEGRQGGCRAIFSKHRSEKQGGREALA